MARSCVIAYRFPPEYSGAGKRAFEFVQYLRTEKHSVIVISSRARHDDFSESDENGRVFRFKRNNLPYPLNRVVENIKIFFLILTHLNQFDYIFIFGRNSLNARVARFFGKTVVYRSTLANTDDYGTLMNNRIIGWYYRITQQMISYHWAISKEIMEKLLMQDIDTQKVIYCPNSVLTKRIIKNQNQLESKQDHFPIKIAFVGEICQRKGFDRVIGLIESLQQEDLKPELYICGPIGDWNLYGKAKTLKYVHYFGIVDDVFEILPKCTFFVFPSRKEGFPTALIEAMSCGLICIASELSVIRDDIIENGVNGFCYSFNRYDEIIETIKRLVIDSNLREEIQNSAINTIVNKFDIDKNLKYLTSNIFGTMR